MLKYYAFPKESMIIHHDSYSARIVMTQRCDDLKREVHYSKLAGKRTALKARRDTRVSRNASMFMLLNKTTIYMYTCTNTVH